VLVSTQTPLQSDVPDGQPPPLLLELLLPELLAPELLLPELLLPELVLAPELAPEPLLLAPELLLPPELVLLPPLLLPAPLLLAPVSPPLTPASPPSGPGLPSSRSASVPPSNVDASGQGLTGGGPPPSPGEEPRDEVFAPEHAPATDTNAMRPTRHRTMALGCSG
jgi:hypothetical protein